jgi:hypothetical protein
MWSGECRRVFAFFQLMLKKADNHNIAFEEADLGQIPVANTILTTTEISGEQPRRDPKKLSFSVSRTDW